MTYRKYSPFSHKGLFKLDTYFSRRGRWVFEDDHPTHSGRGYFLGRWFLRLCLRLRAEWQGVRGILHRVKVFVLEKPSIRKSGAMRIGCWCRAHWLLMLCALLVDALCIDVAFIGCWNCVRWLLRFCTLAVDTLSIDVDDERIDVNVAFNGCWHSVHWTLSLSALLINTECFAWWCSAHWMLLLSALMLMLSALMLILHSLDADALCIAWRCSVHWLLILCALILLSAYWCWCCLK